MIRTDRRAIRAFGYFVLLLAGATLLTALLAGCSGKQSSSGTTGAVATDVPGARAGTVLEFEGTRYRLVAIVPRDRVEQLATLKQIGTGRVTSDQGSRDIAVYRAEDEDVVIYSDAPSPGEGGGSTDNLVYQWQDESRIEDTEVDEPNVPDPEEPTR